MLKVLMVARLTIIIIQAALTLKVLMADRLTIITILAIPMLRELMAVPLSIIAILIRLKLRELMVVRRIHMMVREQVMVRTVAQQSGVMVLGLRKVLTVVQRVGIAVRVALQPQLAEKVKAGADKRFI
jgi:hypothetical protein